MKSKQVVPPKDDIEYPHSDTFRWLDAHLVESQTAPDDAIEMVFQLHSSDWQLLESVWNERSTAWRQACAYVVGAGPVAPSQPLLRLALFDPNDDVATQAAISLSAQMLEHPEDAPCDAALLRRLKEMSQRDAPGNLSEVDELLRRYGETE